MHATKLIFRSGERTCRSRRETRACAETGLHLELFKPQCLGEPRRQSSSVFIREGLLKNRLGLGVGHRIVQVSVAVLAGARFSDGEDVGNTAAFTTKT